jgi:hypothetical protein
MFLLTGVVEEIDRVGVDRHHDADHTSSLTLRATSTACYRDLHDNDSFSLKTLADSFLQQVKYIRLLQQQSHPSPAVSKTYKSTQILFFHFFHNTSLN